MGRAASGFAVLVVIAAVAASAALAGLGPYGSWGVAQRVEGTETNEPSFNGVYLDGCPYISRDGKAFFMASRRPTSTTDYKNDINIWVSTRAKAGDPWGAPTLVGPPVSIDVTLAADADVNDFCPTLARNGHDFFFVSNRAGGCGGDDIYATRFRADGSIDPVANLGCDVNTPQSEASPFPLPQDGAGPVLYFSSSSTGNGDLYLSQWQGGAYQAREALSVNTAAVEGQPNLRRDGLELFFFSNRAGALGNDIYSASRATVSDAWQTPVNLGSNVNGTGMTSETRPSLSWDGTTLYFGSNRAGGDGDADHYVTTRAVSGS